MGVWLLCFTIGIAIVRVHGKRAQLFSRAEYLYLLAVTVASTCACRRNCGTGFNVIAGIHRILPRQPYFNMHASQVCGPIGYLMHSQDRFVMCCRQRCLHSRARLVLFSRTCQCEVHEGCSDIMHCIQQSVGCEEVLCRTKRIYPYC